MPWPIIIPGPIIPGPIMPGPIILGIPNIPGGPSILPLRMKSELCYLDDRDVEKYIRWHKGCWLHSCTSDRYRMCTVNYTLYMQICLMRHYIAMVNGLPRKFTTGLTMFQARV